MMRFADFNNPALLEALGDLLLAGKQEENAAQLAALCYMQAAQQTSDQKAQTRLISMCALSVRFTKDFDREYFEKLLHSGLAKGESYFQSIRKDELEWIAAGVDASVEFQKKYLPAK